MEFKLVPYDAARIIPARRVLVLAPHPDDEVLGCGGAILRHVEAGVPVRVAIVTDGALGLDGEARARHVAVRQAESRAAAAVLGYGEPEFWGVPDQALTYGEALVHRITAALADADLVYAPSIFEMHPDHRALGMAAVEAVRRIGGELRLAMYEVGVPLRPNLLLDISDVAERKQAALQAFASQLEGQPYDQHISALNRYRTYTLPAAVTAAEAFHVAAGDDLARDPLEIYRSEHTRQRALGLILDGGDTPLVSVIVRSCGRRELPEALDSIALQTYPNIEVLVVDAKGRGPDLPAAWGRFPLRVVGTGAPLGRGPAANLGLDAARGELVMFLDEDDLFLPNHVARLVEVKSRSPGARAAFAGVRVDGEAGIIDVYDQRPDLARLLAWNHLPILGVLFERALAEEGCRFDEDLDLYEDWDFWLQVARQTPFAHAEGVSAVYRAHLGASALTQPGHDAARIEARHGVWKKWLPQWSPEAFGSLVQAFREREAEQDRAVAYAAFTERELRRMLEEAAEERDAAVAAVQATLDRTVAEIHGSTSWRLTAPLRALVHLFRGAR